MTAVSVLINDLFLINHFPELLTCVDIKLLHRIFSVALISVNTRLYLRILELYFSIYLRN